MDKKIGPEGYRIDDRVAFTKAGLILVSLFVLGFRFRNTDPCMDVGVDVKAPSYYQGGAGFVPRGSGPGQNLCVGFQQHRTYEMNQICRRYSTPSESWHLLCFGVGNGHCEGFDTVTVIERLLDKTPLLEPSLIAPDRATVNRPITFIDTSDATSSKWRCGESGLVDGVTQKISYA